MKPELLKKIIKLSYANMELPNSRHAHFSFIVLRNKILSMGWNNGFKTSPIGKKYGHRFSSIHSEVAAVQNFHYEIDLLSRCRLVNVRIMRSGQIGISKPCRRCMTYLDLFNFKEIWYSTSYGFESCHRRGLELLPMPSFSRPPRPNLTRTRTWNY